MMKVMKAITNKLAEVHMHAANYMTIKKNILLVTNHTTKKGFTYHANNIFHTEFTQKLLETRKRGCF